MPAYDFVNSAIPGMPGLTKSASGYIGSLLGGMPGTSLARRQNAYFGAGSGVPGSDFVRNRGLDLYGQQAAANKQQGLQGLLQMLGSYAAPQQAAASLEEQGRQYDVGSGLQREQLGQNKYLSEMQLLPQSTRSRIIRPKYGLEPLQFGYQGSRGGSGFLYNLGRA